MVDFRSGKSMCYNAAFTMVTVADNEVKDRLDELLTAAEGGQTVAITKNGKAVVQMAAMPNGAGQFVPPLDSIDDETYQRNMENWLCRVEEFRKKLREEKFSVSRETIMEVFREMRGR